MAAMDGKGDTRGWLEERLLNDRSPDVKAAALGAMVVQAHYNGSGEAVMDHLARIRKMTEDPEVQEMIAAGEEMVREHDPRRLDLELAEEARFYGDIAMFTEGAARQDMRRRAAYLDRMVAALKAQASR